VYARVPQNQDRDLLDLTTLTSQSTVDNLQQHQP
jgi:hypothetical protein